MKKAPAPKDTTVKSIASELLALKNQASQGDWQARLALDKKDGRSKEILNEINTLVEVYAAAVQRAEQEALLNKQTSDDAKAVTGVVADLSSANTVQEAASIALSSVRSAFGWAYGSYWAIDPKVNVLKFAVESGSVNHEFQKITLEATIAFALLSPAAPVSNPVSACPLSSMTRLSARLISSPSKRSLPPRNASKRSAASATWFQQHWHELRIAASLKKPLPTLLP